MKRSCACFAALLVAGTVQAQMECRTDPQSADLQFAVSADGKALEFRGKRPDRNLGKSCSLTLDCTVRGLPSLIDYFIMPQRAGDPPAVWNIRSVHFKFAGGGEQDCLVTATSDPRAPLAEPPPFIRMTRKK